jgi:hypothetical protein
MSSTCSTVHLLLPLFVTLPPAVIRLTRFLAALHVGPWLWLFLLVSEGRSRQHLVTYSLVLSVFPEVLYLDELLMSGCVPCPWDYYFLPAVSIVQLSMALSDSPAFFLCSCACHMLCTCHIFLLP